MLLTLQAAALASGLMGALTLLLALAIDRYLGEPPPRLHPVVWMGRYLDWAGKRLQRVAPDCTLFWLGALYWIGGAALFVIAAWGLEKAVLQCPPDLSGEVLTVSGGAGLMLAKALLVVLLLAALLKPMFAWAMLKSEVQAVEVALAQSLSDGRERLSWLVSRDTATLSEAQVRESVIESLAENLSDSVVAPIFWFVLLGLPGAVLYRFANTADAMWGYPGVYKGQNWAWAGKWAARADDALNWLPARLTGLTLCLLVKLFRRAVRPALKDLRIEAAKTPSPNSGWPMAAMALALGIHLTKPGVYVLNPAGGEPLAEHTLRAIFYASKVLLALLPIALTAIFIKALIV